MDSLVMGTKIGGMDLRPHDRAVEQPVRYMFSTMGKHSYLWPISNVLLTYIILKNN